MSLEVLVATITRGVGYLALAALIGGLAVDHFVVPDDGSELHEERRRLRRLRVACLVALIMTSLAEVVLRGRTMTGAGWPVVLRAVPVILVRTHFGHVWLVRFTLLGGTLCLAGSMARAARAVMLLMALAIAFTTTATGHAGDWGDVSPTAVIDYLHVAASSLWVGGLLSLVILGRPSVAGWRSAQFRTIGQRFSRLAGWSLLAVVLSGSYNAWVQVATPSGMWTTTYGRVLSIKLAIVVVLISLGAISRYTIVARLTHHRGSGVGARCFCMGRLALFGTRRVAQALLPSRFIRYVSREALLGVAVLACTAVLGTPPRHAMLHTLGIKQPPQPRMSRWRSCTERGASRGVGCLLPLQVTRSADAGSSRAWRVSLATPSREKAFHRQQPRGRTSRTWERIIRRDTYSNRFSIPTLSSSRRPGMLTHRVGPSCPTIVGVCPLSISWIW